MGKEWESSNHLGLEGAEPRARCDKDRGIREAL